MRTFALLYARFGVPLLALTLLVTAVAVLSFVSAGVAEARVVATVFAGTSLAMAVPANPGLAPEIQHVINALEAHFNAIGDALSKGAPSWLEAHVQEALDDVKAALDKLGVTFAQEFEALKARVAGKAAGPGDTAKAA